MRVLLVNPPYQTLTSNLGVGHQVPLGLLMVGGSLIDAGHHVSLLDAESHRLSIRAVADRARRLAPDFVMTGHAGSTPAHPVCARTLHAVKQACPRTVTVYGGVYPTYHARPILGAHPAIDIIVRAEGEATAADLLSILSAHGPDPAALRQVPSIAFRAGRDIVLTDDRPPIPDLDAHRTAWELIDDWDRYRCFGRGRAAIVQFSRGCPHRCTYCGQRGFWVKWRHRDPASLADEIATLHRVHNVRFITLADENPTTLKPIWRRFLEELITRRLDLHFFATIRASDIVRDADILHLYRQAGILYVLMGIETTTPAVIDAIRKRSTTSIDGQACRLLADHGIRSIVGHIVGLEDETAATFRRARRVLRHYRADLVNAMYVTPHSWTAFAHNSAHRPVVQENQELWDYRHQILGNTRLKPWQLFSLVKWLELAHHATPRNLWRLLAEPDPLLRQQLRWTTLHTGAVWFAEIADFLLRTRFARQPRPLAHWLQGAHPDPHHPRAPQLPPMPLSITARRPAPIHPTLTRQ